MLSNFRHFDVLATSYESFETWETPENGSGLKCTESLLGGCIPTSVNWDELRPEYSVKLTQAGFLTPKNLDYSVMSDHGFPYIRTKLTGRHLMDKFTEADAF